MSVMPAKNCFGMNYEYLKSLNKKINKNNILKQITHGTGKHQTTSRPRFG